MNNTKKVTAVILWRVGIRNARGWNWCPKQFGSYAEAEKAYHDWINEHQQSVFGVSFRTEVAYR